MVVFLHCHKFIVIPNKKCVSTFQSNYRPQKGKYRALREIFCGTWMGCSSSVVINSTHRETLWTESGLVRKKARECG